MEPLTRVEINSLRKADDVVFVTKGNESKIELIKKDDKEFGGERRMSIAVGGIVESLGGRGPAEQASCVILSARFHPQWATVTDHVLRAGDRLTLKWTAGNMSEAMRAAGFWEDMLDLRVERRPRSGSSRARPKVMTFQIYNAITNSVYGALVKTT